ncbi:MAG TPA: LacI family DNA-binding transcriptional regulator [Streptosporangiaceae bacterium]
MPTVYDVARLAGVSTATVSRVMRSSDLVRPVTRDRVLAVIEEVGFVPDASAQGLSRRRKDIIGLVGLERGVDESGIERDGLLFVDVVVHAVEAVLRGTGTSLLLSFGRAGEQFHHRIRALSGKVDGLLVVEEALAPAQLRALARRLPVVVIAAPAGEAALDVVRVDNPAGMRALATHLTTVHGYRRLGFVGGPRDAPDAMERLAAFATAVRGVPGGTVDVVPGGDFSEASGRTAARVLLGREAIPEAVACANDQMAIGVMRELQRSGLDVPGDVAVAGFDNIYPGRVVEPALTTVGQPVRELGVRAAARLMGRIEGSTEPPHAETLPTELVIRRSCGCPGRVREDLPPASAGSLRPARCAR